MVQAHEAALLTLRQQLEAETTATTAAGHRTAEALKTEAATAAAAQESALLAVREELVAAQGRAEEVEARAVRRAEDEGDRLAEYIADHAVRLPSCSIHRCFWAQLSVRTSWD